MPARIASDHPAVENHRVRVERHGGGRRLTVPGDIVPSGEVIRLIIGEQTRFGAVTALPGREEAIIPGAYERPAAARDPGGHQDVLAGWLADHGVDPGGTVFLDVIESDVAYGIRIPGEREVYEAVDPPSSSLQEIARNLDDED